MLNQIDGGMLISPLCKMRTYLNKIDEGMSSIANQLMEGCPLIPNKMIDGGTPTYSKQNLWEDAHLFQTKLMEECLFILYRFGGEIFIIFYAIDGGIPI